MRLSILRLVPPFRRQEAQRWTRLSRAVLAKFFADRGTHLAAMIAYFALLSFVPLLFLSLVDPRRRDQADPSSFFVRSSSARSRARRSTRSCVRVGAIQENATALGILGAAFLLWSSLSLFSVLESAFNIVYGRPNRGFLRGKALASLMMVGSLVVLFAALVVGSVGAELLRRHASVVDNAAVATIVSVAVSLVGIFVFLATRVLRADERGADLARGAAGRGRRRPAARGDVPAAAAVRPRLEPQPCAAGALVAGAAAGLALRDGERDRARRRGQLARAARAGRDGRVV